MYILYVVKLILCMYMRICVTVFLLSYALVCLCLYFCCVPLKMCVCVCVCVNVLVSLYTHTAFKSSLTRWYTHTLTIRYRTAPFAPWRSSCQKHML